MGKRGAAQGIDIDWLEFFRTGNPEPLETMLSPPAAPAALPHREVAVVEKPPKKICHGLGSNDLDSSGRQVWADLTDSLLHLIIVLFSSFHDFLAVTSTCRSWRATISSFPPIYHFSFPPLFVKTGLHYARRHMGDRNSCHNPLSNYKWQLRDPAKTNLSLRCSAPRHTPYYVCYLGCSYGYLILYCEEQCFLVDVYTSTMVKPRKFQRSDNSKIYYGVFTAPLSSPNSCLLLFSRKYMFRWQVGTKSWMEHPLVAGRIHQIVSFKGQMLAMDSLMKLNTISLAPQLGMPEEPLVWGEDMTAGLLKKPWLVVRGDMLLKVDLSIHDLKFCFQAYRLDLSVRPAKWAKMKKLGNWVLFLSLDRRSSTFSCLNPERWDGKSNFIYVLRRSKDSNEPWIEIELGQFMSRRSHPISYILGRKGKQLESFWVLPSLVYGVNK
ncbi:hypothetical protein VPH35_120795 [Triticum aestivum]